MGCAACFRGHGIAEPYRRGSIQSRSILEQQLKQLQPSRLVHEEEFQRLWKRLAEHCESSSRAMLPASEEEIAVGRSATAPPLSVLTCKWKLLIFCRGFDFYEKQQDQCASTLEHSCFAQIGKDLHRTFPEETLFQTPQGIQSLQRCLNRVALYFPRVGYTQGVNFIVGYLMLRGYNQHQTFWMVTHLVLCQRYLLLGLFEDGFPLAAIYCRLFRLLLRQQRPRLHARLLELGVSDEIWVFKWFMTYFLYSFPMEVVEQAWDAMLMLGGIGLVYFAFAIVEQIEGQLMRCEDDAEVSAVVSGLKDIKIFRTMVNLDQAVSRSYEIKLSEEDIAEEMKLAQEAEPKQSFYTKYFANAGQRQQQELLVEEWRAKLKAERVEYRNRQLQSKRALTNRERPRRKETKFRVKDQQRKEEQLKVEQFRRSSLVLSQNSNNGNPDGHELHSSGRQKDEISNLSRVLSQANSEHIPSEESVMQIIVPQESNRSDRRSNNEAVLSSWMNASVHVIAAEVHDQQQQHQIEIFDLKGKPISFKKKKTSENGVLKVPRGGRIFKKASEKELKPPRNNPSISKHDAREILQSIENEDRSVVEFEGSSNFLESTSDKKPPEELPPNESIKVISLEDGGRNHSIEVESVR